MNKAITTREAAADCLEDITDHKKPGHIVLGICLKEHSDWTKQERAFVSRLVSGTVERLLTIDYVLDQLSKTKVARMKPLIRAVLRMSIYQIYYMEAIPDSAVCNEAVKIVKKRGLQGLSGFVNGILRTVLREKESLFDFHELKDNCQRLSIEYSTPVWLAAQFLKEYGTDTAEKILAAQYKDIPLTVRINESKCSKEAVLQQLLEDMVQVLPGAYYDKALYLLGYDSLDKITAFQKGWITVQDESSMMVGLAADVHNNSTVLDLCAAPGGKSLHLAELICCQEQATGTVEARDISEYKINLIRENLIRSSYKNVSLKIADASLFDADAKEKADIVIADLPCSGTGVIGKKPDIKYNMSREQQDELCLLQKKILRNAAEYIRPGGTLIYSTCTLHKAENEGNREFIINELGLIPDSMADFLPVSLLKYEEIRKTAADGYMQLIPGIQDTDGFFVSRYKKKG